MATVAFDIAIYILFSKGLVPLSFCGITGK
jgi:hypothetical protein